MRVDLRANSHRLGHDFGVYSYQTTNTLGSILDWIIPFKLFVHQLKYTLKTKIKQNQNDSLKINKNKYQSLIK